jgi:hypothetical protein
LRFSDGINQKDMCKIEVYVLVNQEPTILGSANFNLGNGDITIPLRDALGQ